MYFVEFCTAGRPGSMWAWN